uniref:Putative secreted protein n=1 Tax=Ixodes ricinus TaxID=34613 RepID=A0A6B0TYM3_IXORI
MLRHITRATLTVFIRSFILHVCVLTVCAAPDCDSACLASLKASGSFQSGSSLESSSNSGSRILAFFFLFNLQFFSDVVGRHSHLL